MEPAGTTGSSLENLSTRVDEIAKAQLALGEKLLNFGERLLGGLEGLEEAKAQIEALSTRLTREIAACHADIALLERWVDSVKPGARLRHCRRCGRALADYEKGEWHSHCKPGGPEA